MPTSFADKTYAVLSTVPRGRVTTYKALADALGTRAYRAIGQVLRTNPYAPEVPCHRVVATNGTIGGFMGHKTGEAIQKKIALLSQEGVKVKHNRVVNFDRVLYSPIPLKSR